MNKVFIVASAEFSSAVRTKAFIIGLLAMPLFAGGAIALQILLEDHVDSEDRAFAVIDHTGVLYETIEREASERNRSVTEGPESEPTGPRFLPSLVDVGGRALDQARLELSDRIRARELFAFLEIPDSALSPDGRTGEMRYYSDHPTYDDLRDWLRDVLNEEIRRRRFEAHDIQEELVQRLNRRVRIENLGLASKEEGTEDVKEAEEVDELRTYAVPIFLVILLFFVLMSSAPQLLNSVLEEKMSRISEVLLGSATPFQLMMGKLVGGTAVSGLLAAIYIGGGFAVALYYGYADIVPPVMFLWFVFFLVVAVFLFGSVFVAIGAACTDMKDAQTLMMPAMLIAMIPMFTWMTVLQSPSSSFSVAISLFPPATPMLMLLRLAIPPGPPLWQILLSVVLTSAATVACVWAAGKIFRTGLLLQGKSANVREILRWLRT